MMPLQDKFRYISKFVVNEKGDRIGESISVFEDLIILKKENSYYAVPFKHVEIKDQEIHVKGVIQWDRAKKLASRWLHAQDDDSNK